jgi:acetyl-CoA C-acetyltransferase
VKSVYIVSAARTAIGSFLGGFREVPAPALGAICIREALQRAGVLAEKVDEVLMGCVLQAGLGQGAGRQAAIQAGIPQTTPAWTVNQICGSGLKAVALASTMIAAGDAECIVAGGMENMSRAPYVANFVREGRKMGPVEMVDAMVHDGLTDVFSNKHMGLTAEAIAERFALTREEQDAFAAESQARVARAWEAGAFEAEIVPVFVPQRKGDPVVIRRDEHPRPDTTVATLARLRPAFKPDGTVTAGNASGINDGGAAVLVASEDFVKSHDLKPLARIVSHATTALDPWFMGLGPIEAARKALARAAWKLEDVERAELNEAFASQSLAVMRELGIDPAITNVNGGAIALGHPIGASGARILVTLLHELQRSGKTRGLAALCVGGGMGTAMLVERI